MKYLRVILFVITTFMFVMIVTSCGYNTCPTYAFRHEKFIKKSVIKTNSKIPTVNPMQYRKRG